MIPVTHPPYLVILLSHHSFIISIIIIIVIKTIWKYPYQKPFSRLCPHRDVDIIISLIVFLSLSHPLSFSLFIIWNHPATFKVLAKRWYFILIAYHWHAKYFLSRKKTNNVTNDTATTAGYCTHVMKCWKYFIIMQRKKSLRYITYFVR